MKNKILITGATGNVGAELVDFLIKKKQDIVIGVRNIDKAKKEFNPNNELIAFVTLDFTTRDTYQSDIKKIFLIRPPKISDVEEDIFPFIDKAKEQGVEHIVFLSLLGVENNRFVPHYKIEQYLKNVGIAYTFLRASFFMQNLNTTHRQDIKKIMKYSYQQERGKPALLMFEI